MLAYEAIHALCGVIYRHEFAPGGKLERRITVIQRVLGMLGVEADNFDPITRASKQPNNKIYSSPAPLVGNQEANTLLSLGEQLVELAKNAYDMEALTSCSEFEARLAVDYRRSGCLVELPNKMPHSCARLSPEKVARLLRPKSVSERSAASEFFPNTNAWSRPIASIRAAAYQYQDSPDFPLLCL